ncbi:MAG: hypothetical protein QF569_26335, partial [Candidatus Poribacteria bacterium]|nr:hypothetical protein [Candidatus Poribacteria bacterium]
MLTRNDKPKTLSSQTNDRSMKLIQHLLVLSSGLLLLFVSHPLHADDLIWTGAASGDWQNPGNWSNAAGATVTVENIPQMGDRATFDGTPTNPPDPATIPDGVNLWITTHPQASAPTVFYLGGGVDGQSISSNLVTGSDGIYGITIYGDQIYWAGNNSGENAIRSANLDGTNLVDLVTGLADVFEITIYGDQIYWAGNNSGENAIRSANLDGTNLVDLVTGL